MSPSRTLQVVLVIATFCAAVMQSHAQGYAPNFSCANWDSYTPQQFYSMASGGSRIGENGRKCRIGQGGPTTACNYYVKYNTDGSNNWLGLSFQGVPGAGSGCCSSVWSCSTAVGAGAWLKSQHKNICCEPQVGPYNPIFSCANWDSYTPQQFYSMASGGSRIGENGRKCRIGQGGPTTACNYYVKYNTDGSNNWLGLSFQGVLGAGSGCCSSVSSCSTAVGAGAWLKSQHKNICCEPQVGLYNPIFSCANWDSYTPQQFYSMASGGSRIGENGRKCRIGQGGPTTACNYYVKYNTDGSNNWLGLSFQGVLGAGSGCCSSVSSCSTAAGAGAWLKSQHKNICCEPARRPIRHDGLTFRPMRPMREKAPVLDRMRGDAKQ